MPFRRVQIYLKLLKSEAPTPEQHEFIERVGRWWELVGSRSGGRILGWLMICDPPHRSAAQLAEELRLSAGSVSTQTTALERIGFVERITFPGDRVSYYRMPPNVWLEQMRAEADRVRDLRDMAAAAADVIPQERRDRVEDLERVAAFFLERWPGMLEELAEYLKREKS